MGYTVRSEYLVMSIFLVGLFGGGAVTFLIVMARGNLALRVDSEGVTVGSSPLGREIPGRTVPWSDIQAIVMFTQNTGKGTMNYVGVMRQPGLEPLPASPGPRALRASEWLIPGISRDILATSVPVNGWSLDKERLSQAIKLNAPRVPLWDRRR